MRTHTQVGGLVEVEISAQGAEVRHQVHELAHPVTTLPIHPAHQVSYLCIASGSRQADLDDVRQAFVHTRDELREQPEPGRR